MSSVGDYDNTRYLHEHDLEIEQQEQRARECWFCVATLVAGRCVQCGVEQ